jgi:hypothetical protein
MKIGIMMLCNDDSPPQGFFLGTARQGSFFSPKIATGVLLSGAATFIVYGVMGVLNSHQAF